MAFDLFKGSPLQSSQYVTSYTETPKWMQDAIYQQIQVAQNLASAPYQPYTMPTVAELSPLQQQAYQKVQDNQGVWKPQLNAATTGMEANANTPGGAQAAQPWLNQSAQSSVANINDYMNPYTSQVTDRIAQLGARNLSENLLPAVSDSFVRAGSFGGTRMGEFGSRALRDTQESVLGQQAQALQTGYGQALGASQTDQSRLASLGSTIGQLSGADLTRQQSALSQMAQLVQQGQQMSTADVAALEAAGVGVQNQKQRELTAAEQQFQQQQLYPKQQMDWLSTQVRGMAPITPQSTTQAGTTTGQTYSASPLSQLATGLYTYKGLQGLG